MVKAMRSKTVLSWFFSLLLFGFLLLSAGTSHSFDIHEINAAIQARGGEWFAKETPLSYLGPEEMKNWTGGLEPSPPYSDLPVGDFYSPVPLSSFFDWTSHNGKNYVTGIRNQGGCGSCWAFATTAALESKSLITFNTPNQDLDLSEQIVLSCTGGQNNCNGGYMEDAADFIKNSGTAGESCYPYTQTNGSCGQACSSRQNDPYKIDNWWLVYQWQSPDISALKNAISSSGPVVVWMQVFQDLQSYGGGVYSYSWGNPSGGHFVLVVGWDDSKGPSGALKVKNSWGPNWGENGFFWIAYSEFGNNSKTQFAKGAMAFGNAVHGGPSPTQKPNLIPYQPTAWSDKIVVSNETGTYTDSSPLKSTDTLYIDFAVDNDSDVPINSQFYAALYVDGVLKNSWSWDSLNAHYYGYVEDYSIGSLGAGSHTIKIVVDSTGAIGETNEGDNEYTKTITIQSQTQMPNLIPYQPSGWSDKIVVSTGTGTNTDSSPLKSTDTLYIDIAVDNDSDVEINSQFYAALYVDGVLKNSWSVDSLNAHHYAYVTDYSIGSLDIGTHSIKIVVDSTGAISETNEGDNEYTKAITVAGNTSGPDLSVEYASFTKSCSRSSCKISGIVEIDNVGNRDARSTFTEIYLYDDGSDDFILLKRISTSSIKKGYYKTLKVSAPLPRGENGSGKYIAVFADADDIMAEPDEENNLLLVGPFP